MIFPPVVANRAAASAQRAVQGGGSGSLDRRRKQQRPCTPPWARGADRTASSPINRAEKGLAHPKSDATALLWAHVLQVVEVDSHSSVLLQAQETDANFLYSISTFASSSRHRHFPWARASWWRGPPVLRSTDLRWGVHHSGAHSFPRSIVLGYSTRITETILGYTRGRRLNSVPLRLVC